MWINIFLRDQNEIGLINVYFIDPNANVSSKNKALTMVRGRTEEFKQHLFH